MASYISIFNNKGGVGKSTITWNLGNSLAEKGKKVIMVDFDAQCNLSIAALGDSIFNQHLPTINAPYGTTIRSYLQRFIQNTGGEEFFSFSLPNSHENLKIVAGDFWLNVYAESLSVGADLLTGNGIVKYAALRHLIEAGQKNGLEVDYVLIDLPPSFGSLVRAALYCSDYFIVPCTSDSFSPYCISLIGQMLPKFITDWEVGISRFKDANPAFASYDSIGRPKFAGWIYNGFDTRSGKYTRADDVHSQMIYRSIKDNLLDNGKILKSENFPEDSMIGAIEDMNVLAQNSLWLSVPVKNLGAHKPVKDLKDRGSWSQDQRDHIDNLGKRFDQIADNVIKICI